MEEEKWCYSAQRWRTDRDVAISSEFYSRKSASIASVNWFRAFFILYFTPVVVAEEIAKGRHKRSKVTWLTRVVVLLFKSCNIGFFLFYQLILARKIHGTYHGVIFTVHVLTFDTKYLFTYFLLFQEIVCAYMYLLLLEAIHWFIKECTYICNF